MHRQLGNNAHAMRSHGEAGGKLRDTWCKQKHMVNQNNDHRKQLTIKTPGRNTGKAKWMLSPVSGFKNNGK